MSDDGRGGGFLGGFLLGAIVGGAVAVFLTQEETRDLLVGKAREASNFAVDASGDLRGHVSDVTSQWQESAADLYERGRSVVENARTNFNAAVDEGTERAQAQREELERKADS
jgi:gas vesicle protein